MPISAGAPAAATMKADLPEIAVAAAPAEIAAQPLDATAETQPDTALSLADEMTRRAEAMMLAQQQRTQMQQVKLDAMRANFDSAQQEHAELLREMNVMREMAMEQMKHEDEFLKKWIALI